MKPLLVLLIIAAILTIVPVAAAQSNDADCKPEVVKEWMIQRQVGRNRITEILDSGAQMSALDELLAIQKVRRDLEALQRPRCADQLYELTIYFYDGLTDYIAFHMAGDTKARDEIWNSRTKYYADTVDSLYLQLEKITGVDIKSEADKIHPVPTITPTPEPLKPISFDGPHGGVVLGPIDIPTGIYKMVLSGSSVSAKTETIKGNCGSSYIYTSGSSESNTEEIFKSDNCRALIEIGVTDKPWKLVFTPVQ